MISVVIPAYNSGKYLVDAVKSVLSQKVRMELIIVDDCSTDSCVPLLVEWISNNYNVSECFTEDKSAESFTENGDFTEESKPYGLYWSRVINNVFLDKTNGDMVNIRCRIYRNKINLGVAETRNIAVGLSEGDYIAFLDADDWWTDDKLVRQLLLMKSTGAVLCNTARELMRPDGRSTGTIIGTPDRIGLKQLKRTNYINCSSVLIKKEALLKYPMEHSDAQEDYLTWLRLLAEYKTAVGINEPLMKYRLTAGGKSRNKLKSAVMTYKTYCYAGYGRFRAGFMMIAYTYNGFKKYRFGKIK